MLLQKWNSKNKKKVKKIGNTQNAAKTYIKIIYKINIVDKKRRTQFSSSPYYQKIHSQ